MPIGADLILHENPDPEAIMLDGSRLGAVVEQAARRYRTPLAFPLMDLRLEKADLLDGFGIPGEEADSFAFSEPPGQVALVVDRPFAKRNQAHIDAVRHIATRTDLLPVGMAIGPFSLTTKLDGRPHPRDRDGRQRH